MWVFIILFLGVGAAILCTIIRNRWDGPRAEFVDDYAEEEALLDALAHERVERSDPPETLLTELTQADGESDA